MMGRARVLGQWKDYAARRITNGGPTLPQDCHELLSCVLVSYGLHRYMIGPKIQITVAQHCLKIVTSC